MGAPSDPAAISLSTRPVGVRGLHPQDAKRGIQRFLELVKARKHSRKPGESRLSRATEMRPYRFCVQDVVLAIWAMAHRKDSHCVEVDVFLTSEVYEKESRCGGYYDPLAGATAATLTILSEAYRVGCPLRVQFTDNVEGGWVPRDIELLAERHDVQIAGVSNGIIEPHEGRDLYLALTGFRPALRRTIALLSTQQLLTPERAAYIVHHGVWTMPEVEGVIMCSAYPDIVLSGDAAPEHRHLYKHVLTHSRLALMGGLLDRTLMARDDAEVQRGVKTPGLDVEDDERNLDIRTNARLHGREYVLVPGPIPDQLPLPDWDCARSRLDSGERLSVLLRPRADASLDAYLSSDIEQAARRAQEDPRPKMVAVAVPFDFHDLSLMRQAEFLSEAQKKDVVLMVCPESTKSLDQMAQKKMAASRIRKD